MDLVYSVRQGDDNEELRYSLRSLCNYRHGKVFIVGHTPSWVKNVISVKTKQGVNKHLNVRQGLMQVCQMPELSEDFVLMNDDFYFMEPCNELKVMHRGYMQSVINALPNNNYKRGTIKSRIMIKEYVKGEPLSYELHMPMPMNKNKLLVVLQLIKMNHSSIVRPQFRSLYGNLHCDGGQMMADCKGMWSKGDPFYSSSDATFKNDTFVHERFKEWSNYEIRY